jgi:hypothetical protein
MTQSIKITALTNIGANIAYTSLVPVVNMSGTPETQKANLQIVGNLILNGAGGSYFPAAAQSVLAQTVSNAAQPNITSVGTLTSLAVTGNITGANANLGNVVVANFFSGDGGFLSNVYSNSTVANYLPNYTGNIGAGNINVATDLNVLGTTTVTALNTDFIGANGNISVTPAYHLVGNLRTQEISGTGNVNIVTSAGNVNGTWVFTQGGALKWPGPNDWVIEPNGANEFEIHSHSNVVISTDTSNANLHFTFDSNGDFDAPNNVTVGNNVSANTFTGTLSTNAQPNITSVGTLLNLLTSGNITLAANISVEGNTNPVSATDTTIAFKIPVTINGNVYYIALTAAQ